jgi:phage shock protein A
MGIFKKISDLARANLNALIDKLEDPKKLAEMAIFDLEAQKKKAKSLLISQKALVNLSSKRLQQFKDDIDALAKTAEQKLKENDEPAAKRILEKKQELFFTEQRLSEQIKQEQNAIERLQHTLNRLDQKTSERLISPSIASSQKHLEQEDAFQTFARMEEKIEFTEHEIEALKELLSEDNKKDALGAIKASFDQHSDPQALEEELKAMKKKLNG